MIFKKVHAFSVEIPFDLVDAGKMLHHPNYMVLYERARHCAMKEAGYSFNDMWESGFSLALTENLIRYHRPAELGQAVVILTSLIEVSTVRMIVVQKMFAAEKFKSVVPDGYYECQPTEWEDKAISEVQITLASVKLNPIRACRFPEQLVQAYQLP